MYTKSVWAFVVATAMVGLPVGSALGGGLLSDDFQGYTPGAPPVPPWQEFYAGPGMSPVYSRAQAESLGVTVKVTDTVSYSGSGQSVHFHDTAGWLIGTTPTVGSRLYRDFPAAASVVLEFYMRSDNDYYEGAFAQLRGHAGRDHAIAFCGDVGGGRPGYIGIISGTGWPKPDLLAYEEGKWYYVRRELDCATNTGTFFVQDVAAPANSAVYSIGSYDPSTVVNEIMFYTSGSQGADCYIDEVAITPEPGTLALLALGGVAMVRRRRATGRGGGWS